MAEMSHVELLGLPCSGKSYLAVRLAGSRPNATASLAEKDKRPSRFLKVLAAAAGRPSLFGLFATIREVKPRNRFAQTRAVLRFISRYGEMATAARGDYGVVVVDEGVVQATWGLFLIPSLDRKAPIPRERLEEFSQKFWPLGKPGFSVLYLDTPRDVILERAVSRSANHPFTRIQLSGRSDEEDIGLRLMGSIVEIAERHKLVIPAGKVLLNIGVSGNRQKSEE